MSRRYVQNMESPMSVGGIGGVDLDDSAVNRSFATVTSSVNTSSAHTTASSSKAVLAALRALQDKIRRLEAERTQALDEASDLRSKLKSHEIESDHARQRDALHAQQQIREARAAYEKLVEEKRELEDRLRKLEERNMDSDHQLNDMTSQISQLSETKAINDNRLKDLTMKFQSLENQLQLCQQRERDLTNAMMRETKKHEDDNNQARLNSEKLADELARSTSARVINDTKLSELDHLVAQLLAVNESLLNQLSGRSITKKKISDINSTRSKSAVTKKRPKTMSAKIERLLMEDAGTLNTNQLSNMHRMYKSLAQSIVTSGGKSDFSSLSRDDKPKTRMAKKKKETAAKAVSSVNISSKVPTSESQSRVSVEGSSNAGKLGANVSTKKKVNIRVPKTSVSFVDESISSSQELDTGSDYKTVIDSLEDEFDELNEQYRRLLSSTSMSESTAELHGDSTDELVDVIQKLHRKGEQLRAIKSPEKK